VSDFLGGGVVFWMVLYAFVFVGMVCACVLGGCVFFVVCVVCVFVLSKLIVWCALCWGIVLPQCCSEIC